MYQNKYSRPLAIVLFITGLLYVVFSKTNLNTMGH